MAQSRALRRERMTPQERHRCAMELFDRARELAGVARQRFLDEALADDVESRQYVESLLQHDATPLELISAIEQGRGVQLVDLDSSDDSAGAPTLTSPVDEQIGVYRLVEKIGEGGFGVVYRAEQRGPFQREVAIKLIKPGMDSRQVVARFEAERQALACMDHAAIARILDGGATDDGRPFFVMEFVRGEPICAYCDKNGLSIGERLKLFTAVCEAVQHAHTKGVVHRDLKPGNILVARDAEGRPQPKIIDFGVAKALHQPRTERTLFTEHGQLIGTPEFMSPEQAETAGADIDTRSDVYSLGVILYELLVGVRPFDKEMLRRAGLAEIARIIREIEPPRPSARLASLGPSSVDRHAIMDARRTDARWLTAALRRDLDWVVMKCLEKDRRRRYETVDALALELKRYLNHEPVLAGPPGTAYRLRKFIRRNRGAVAAGALVALTLVAATAVSAWFGWREASARARESQALARESQQRKLAEQRAEDTQEVADFQGRMLGTIDVEAMGRGIKDRFREQVRAALAREYVGEYPDRRRRTPEEVEAELAVYDACTATAQPVDVARQVMDEYVLKRAAEALEAEFRDQPSVQAQIHDSIGGAYLSLGLIGAAEPHVRAALQLRRQEFGPEHEAVAASLNNLGELLRASGDYAGAESTHREALALRRKLLGEHREAASSLNNLASVLTAKGAYATAEPLFREALTLYRKLPGDEDEHLATILNNLGNLLHFKGDYDAAEPLFREALALNRKRFGEEHPHVAATMNNLASVLKQKGEIDGAERLLRDVIALHRKLLGDEHPSVAAGLNNLALVLKHKGDYAAAEPLLREALAINQRLLGDEHPIVASALNNLAELLKTQGDLAAAEPLYRQALELRRRLLGDDHPDVVGSLNNLAGLSYARGDLADAESLLRETLAISRKVLGEEHPVAVSTLHNLAGVLHAKGDAAAAEPLYREAIALRRQLLGEEHPDVAQSLKGLGELLRAQRDYAAAEPLLREALTINRKVLGDSHPEVALCLNNLAGVLYGEGDYAAAEPLIREALALYRRQLGDEHPYIATSLGNLGDLLQAQGNYAAAGEVYREALAMQRRLLGEEHPDVLLSRTRLAQLPGAKSE